MGMGLGRRLLKASFLTKRVVEEDESESEEEEEGGKAGEDDISLGSSLDDDMRSIATSSIFSSKSSLMAQGATADCVLIAGGRRMYCHLVVLAKRCARIRDMIYEEHRPNEEGMCELILPELRFEVARCLVQYL